MRKVRIFLVSVLTVFSIFFIGFSEEKQTVGAIEVDLSDVFSNWINYPDKSIGSAYQADWSYNPTIGLTTSQNVGWTGFYNPSITDFTTGTFTFDLQSSDHDPLGFTWGMKTGGTTSNPVYSFYAFEECGDGFWSVAYIDNWEPALSPHSHQGPLYHSTIDGDDGDYNGTHTNALGTVGFSSGEILDKGPLPVGSNFPKTKHRVKIVVNEGNFQIYLNDAQISNVEKPVIAGSFGPYTTSNPVGIFSYLSYETTSTEFLAANFEFNSKTHLKTNVIELGDEVHINDISTFKNSPIVKREWSVKKDGLDVYRGETPYTEYNKAIGVYETTLTVANANGVISAPFTNTLTVVNKTEVAKPSKAATPTSKANVGVPTSDTTNIYQYVFVLMGAGFILAAKRKTNS